MFCVSPRPASAGPALGAASWRGVLRSMLPLSAALALAGCSGGAERTSDARIAPGKRYTNEPYSDRLIAQGAPVPKGGGTYKLGAPYKIGGRWYVPREDAGYDETGVASWYGDDFHGRRTANGEIYDMNALTAAHTTLPLPSYAYVTNLDNGRTVLVRVNDRGPYANDRVIDLSRQTARMLGYEGRGLARVRVRYAGRAPLDGNDVYERRFLASQPWYNGGAVAAGPQPAPYASGYSAPRQAPVVALQPQPAANSAFGEDADARGWSVTSYRAELAGRRSSLGGP